MMLYVTTYDDIESKRPFYIALALFIIQATYFITHALRDICMYDEDDHWLHMFLNNAALCLFAIQYHILLFLFFDRLEDVFKEHSPLTRRTINTFYIILAAFII